MEQCSRCGINEFDPWAAKDKGQRFPFKSCFSCRQKAREARENFQKEASPVADDKFLQLQEALLKLEKRILILEKSAGIDDLLEKEQEPPDNSSLTDGDYSFDKPYNT